MSSNSWNLLAITQTSPLSQGLLWIRLVPSGHYIDRVLVLGVEDLDRLPLVDTIWSVVCLDSCCCCQAGVSVSGANWIEAVMCELSHSPSP